MQTVAYRQEVQPLGDMDAVGQRQASAYQVLTQCEHGKTFVKSRTCQCDALLGGFLLPIAEADKSGDRAWPMWLSG